jgi:hypothetical protein
MFRFFTFLVGVLVVALVAVAFIRGWVRISAFDKENSNETGATMTIDKTKIKDDVAAVKNKVHLDGKGNEANADVGKNRTKVQGKVKQVGAAGLTLTTAADKTLDLQVARDTDIRIGDQKGSLKDLREGDPVTATYVTQDNRNVATSVRKE